MESTFISPFNYFNNPANSNPVGLGNVYIGLPDTDPQIPANQIQVYVVPYCACPGDENLPASQPLKLSAGGVIIFNNYPVQVIVDAEEYSVKVTSLNGSQMYYTPRLKSIPDQVLAEVTAALGVFSGIKLLPQTPNLLLTTSGYITDSGIGSAQYKWNPDRPWSDHDGGTVLASGAMAVFDGTEFTVNAFINWIPTLGFGCWEIVLGQIAYDIKIRVPSRFPSPSACMDKLLGAVSTSVGVKIVILLESGYSIDEEITVNASDCSMFEIQSEDAEVTLTAGFDTNVISVSNGGIGPTLNCLINASNQTANNGIRLFGGHIFVKPNAGVKNAYATGLLALSGSIAIADYANFSGCARDGTTGSGILSWGSVSSAEYADCTNSGFYGAQAAHAGLLGFKGGDASGAYRHGIRATDAAIVDAELAIANGCGIDGSGSNVRAWEGGIVNFTNGTANDNKGTTSTGAAFLAAGAGSVINARGATSTGNDRYGVWAESGAVVNYIGGTVTSAIGNFQRDAEILSQINEYSGLYTPTLTLGANVTSATTQGMQYSRVGNVVTVSGSIINITPTLGTGILTSVRISLPIDSDFTNARQCGGSGAFYSVALLGKSAAVFAETSANLIEIRWIADSVTVGNLSFIASYSVA